MPSFDIFNQSIPVLFSLLFVVIIAFLKKDFEEQSSFNKAIGVGLVLTFYLYMNSLHPYFVFKERVDLILRIHLIVASFVTIFLIALTDSYFVSLKNRFYLFTPVLTILLMFFVKDPFTALIPNGFVTVFLIYFLVTRFRDQKDSTYLPLLLTGSVAALISFYDTILASNQLRESPPVSGYGFFLYFMTLVLSKIVKTKKMKIESLAVHERVAEVARQVAHDIRSPLAALKMHVNDIENMDPTDKEMLEQGIARISSIISDLVKKESIKGRPEKVHLRNLINLMINEKKSDDQTAVITHDLTSEIEVYCPRAVLERIFSNLLNNSLEAFNQYSADNKIIISAQIQDSKFCRISIRDNGKGIPENLLKMIGHKNFSYGKAQGQGRGVSYLREQLKNWGGDFYLDSKVGTGTTVTFTVPLYKA